LSLENLKHIFQEHGTTTGTPQVPQKSSVLNLNSNFDDVTPRVLSSVAKLKTITGRPQLPIKSSVLNEDSKFDNFGLARLTNILNELPTDTNQNAKAFFGSPIGGPIPQPYNGNPPNSNLINFNSDNDNFRSPAGTNILNELPTDTNENTKAFFSLPTGGPIPQPYSGIPPNSNLLNFNSDNDNMPAVFSTTPNPIFLFNQANSNNGVFTVNGIEKTKFNAPAFPNPYFAQNTIVNEVFQNADVLGNHGWPDLYTPNHKSINITNPVPRSTNPFQPRPGADLDIKTDAGLRSSAIGLLGLLNSSGVDSGTASLANILDGREPYIVSRIPVPGDKSINGRFINFGVRNIPAIPAATDAIRIGKYLTSTEGILNIALKNADLLIPQTVVRKDDDLIRVPQRFNNGYNPIATLVATSPLARNIGHGPNLLTKSGLTGAYNQTGNIDTPGFSVTGLTQTFSIGDSPKYNLNDTFTNASDEEDDGGRFSLKKLGDFLKIDGKVQKTSTGDKMTLAPMIKGKHLLAGGAGTMVMKDESNVEETIRVNVEKKEEGMPFYFKDLRDNTYIFFRAYVDGINEALSPSWSSTNYIGRSEPVYVYERAEREISFNLKLFAQTEKELGAIYAKMNKLTSLCYPQYAKDEFLSTTLSTDSTKVTKTRMKPPLMKLRLGDLYGKPRNNNGTDGGLIGFLGSLSYSIPDEATYETENEKKVPKFIQAAITYKVIHGEVPNMDTQFYGYKGGFNE